MSREDELRGFDIECESVENARARARIAKRATERAGENARCIAGNTVDIAVLTERIDILEGIVEAAGRMDDAWAQRVNNIREAADIEYKEIRALQRVVGELADELRARLDLQEEIMRMYCGPNKYYEFLRQAAEDRLGKPEPYEYESGGGIAGARP